MRGLFIVQSDLDALEAKGVKGMIGDRAENGFLERAVTLHPMAKETRIVEVGPNLPVHELKLPQFDGMRLRRWFGFIMHLLRAVLYARRLAAREQVSFVRAQDPYYSGLIGYMATRWPRIPFGISIHADYDQRHVLDRDCGSPKIFGSRRLAKRLETFLLPRADLVMPIRESLRQQAIRNGAPLSRAIVFPHLVDFTAIRSIRPALPPNAEKMAAGRKVILFAGRLSRENYVWDVVDAARRLGDRGDCMFILIGPGQELDAVRSAILSDSRLRSTMVVCGSLDRHAVHAAQKAAHVGLVLMGGYTLIEFCAMGRPCVTYDVEWHSDLIKNGKTGFILREGDRTGVTKALARLLDDPELSKRLGEAAYSRAQAQYDVHKARPVRQEVYRKLVAAGRGKS